MFTNVITGAESTLSIQTVLLCSVVSLFLGLFIAFIYTLQGTASKSFVITLALLPILVQLVILMVNGNLGTSVAVLGAFGLVRFRSWKFQRYRQHLLCHGNRTCCWNRLSFFCSYYDSPDRNCVPHSHKNPIWRTQSYRTSSSYCDCRTY